MSSVLNISPARRRWKDEPFVVFVEGYSDLIFYAELMEFLGYAKNEYFIEHMEGKARAKLRDYATLLLKPDNLQKMQKVCAILDADRDPAGAFTLAQRAFNDAIGVSVPKVEDWSAKIGATQFGVFIVPGDDRLGEVESLAWSAWQSKPDNAQLRDCIDQFIRCSKTAAIPLKSIDKVRIGSVLSVLNEDDPRLGPGARAGIIDFAAPEFSRLSTFLAH